MFLTGREMFPTLPNVPVLSRAMFPTQVNWVPYPIEMFIFSGFGWEHRNSRDAVVDGTRQWGPFHVGGSLRQG